MYPLVDLMTGTWQGILFFAVAILLAVVVVFFIIRGSKK
jgi:hypothetical protein